MSRFHFVILAIAFVVSFDDGLCLNLTGLEVDRWWGSADMVGKTNDSIRPFTIEWDSKMIEDLQNRLRNRRPAKAPLQGVGFRYGFNSSCVKEWADYWAEEYPFQERLAYFNKYPLYKTNIQGLDIQFIWIKPNVTNNSTVLPLLIMHGFTGGSREFYESIPYFANASATHKYSVELVIPQLPGFGYSDPTFLPGLGAAEIGVIMRNLMHRLGHAKFYIQAGDFGSITASYMSTVFPDEVLGFHTNFPVSILPGFLVQLMGAATQGLLVDSAYDERLYPISNVISGLLEETGYLHEQATKPDTIGLAFADSPTALLTYLLEKIPVSKDPSLRDLPDGGLSTFEKIPILDLFMMYWAPNSMTTSMRLYAETFNKRNFIRDLDSAPTTVPTWALQARHEMVYQPPSILKLKYPNLLKARPLDFGGHFFALDYPDLYAEDVLNALDEFVAWHTDKKAYDAAHPVDLAEAMKVAAGKAFSTWITNSNITSFLSKFIHITL